MERDISHRHFGVQPRVIRSKVRSVVIACREDKRNGADKYYLAKKSPGSRENMHGDETCVSRFLDRGSSWSGGTLRTRYLPQRFGS